MEDEAPDSLVNFIPSQPQEGIGNPDNFQVNPMQTLAENIRNKYPEPPTQQNQPLSMDGPTSLFSSPDTSHQVSFMDYSINPSDLYHQLGDGTHVRRYENYIQGTDNAERLAQQQTRGEKWSHGLQKLGLKTGAAVLGGTVGTVTGLANAIKEGSISAVYTDDFNQMLDVYNEKMEFTLPNYYTREEQDMGFLESMGRANFWANDFLGGLSFTLGMIVSEGIWAAATGGTGLLARGAMGSLGRWSTKSLGASRALKGLREFKQPTKNLINKAAKGQVTALRDATIRGANIQKAFNQARFIYTSAGYEAGVEARHYMKEAEEEYIANFQEQNGRRPTPQELVQVRADIADGANAVYGANVALVGGSNMAIFGKMLLGRPTRQAVNNSAIKRELFGVGYRVKDGTYEAVKANTRQKIAGRAYSILKPMGTEGIIEEGGQSVAATAVKNYVLSAYDETATEETLGIMESVIQGMKETYGTKEGRKEVGLGMLIGLFGGGLSTGGRFNEMSQERQNIQNAVEYRNQYTPDRVLATQIMSERMKANNRIIKANEEAARARENNDITGEYISEQQAILASVERDAALQGTKQGIEDFEAYLATVDNAQLAEDLGLTGENIEGQAQEWKEQKLEDYRNISERYQETERYVRALVGDTQFAGTAELNTSSEQIIKALTYNLTLGEQSKAFTEKIVNDIKTVIGGDVLIGEDATIALDVDQALINATQQAKKRYDRLSKQSRQLQEEKSRIENQLLSEQYNRGEQTTPEQHATNLQRIQGKIIEIDQRLESLNQQKEAAYRALGIENDLITLEDLDTQAERVEQLRQKIEGYKNTNPELYATLNKLFQEYDKSKTNTASFNEMTQQLMNPEFRTNTLNGWLAGILNKNKSLDESTKEFFAEQLRRYETNQLTGNITSQAAQADTTQTQPEEETTEEGDTMEPPKAPTPKTETPLQVIRRKISELMKSNEYTTSYIGNDFEEAVKTKPSQEDLDRYEELLGKINSTYLRNFNQLMNAPEGYFNINNIETGLTAQEREELKQLQQKLSNWKVLEGTIDNENNSIADLMLLSEQLETQAEDSNTKTEITQEEYADIKQSPEQEAQTRYETSEGVQSPDQAMVRLIDVRGTATYSFSHLDVTSLTRLFPNSRLEIMRGKKSKPLDTVKEDTLQRLMREEGTRFVLVTNEGERVNVTIGKRGRLNINKESLDGVLENSNIAIINYGNRNYRDVYERLENGGLIPLRGDFSYESAKEGEIIELVPEVVNNVKEGQILITRINKNDKYNKALIEKYERSEKTEEDYNELVNNLHIYITDQTGQVVGSLRAFQTDLADTTATKHLLDIRLKAGKMILDETIQDEYFSLQEAIPVRVNLIGTPNFVMEQQEDGSYRPSTIDFTETALEKVDAVGYYEGETLTLKGMEDTDVIKTFLPKNSEQKLPVVIININGKQVAFPVTLKSSTTDRTGEVMEILQSDLRRTDKISRINNILLQHGLNPSDYMVQSDGMVDLNYDKVIEDLSEITEYTNLENDFQLDTLAQQAEIGIDLDNRPFNLSKVMLDLTNRRTIGRAEQIREEYNNIENREIELREELQTDFRTILEGMNQYPDVDNVRWTNALFVEEFYRNPKSDNEMRRNVNLMRNALYNEKGHKETPPKEVREVYGDEFINNIREKIEELDRITEQKRKTAEIKNATVKKEKDNQNKPC